VFVVEKLVQIVRIMRPMLLEHLPAVPWASGWIEGWQASTDVPSFFPRECLSRLNDTRSCRCPEMQ
jgi:hypothetical protein